MSCRKKGCFIPLTSIISFLSAVFSRSAVEVLFEFSGKEYRRGKTAFIGDMFDRFTGDRQHSCRSFQTAADYILTGGYFQVPVENSGQCARRDTALFCQFTA